MAHLEPHSQESHKLLVEGRNDKHVVWQLCEQHPAVPDFFIEDRGNVDAVIDSIGAELLAPGRLRLGILVDTDDNLQSRWDEIAHQLRINGVQPPVAPDLSGTIISTGRLRIGIWLMPDNSHRGELEDFVQRMIPHTDRVWLLSRRYINQIPYPERKFSPGKTLRAQIHAWLSTRQEPRLMGSAIRTNDLDTNTALSQTFLAWLSRLYA